MNRLQLMARARSLTRDLTNSVFREVDIYAFLDEGIDRIKQVIPELEDMEYLSGSTEEPTLLPASYHSLLSTYCASRLYFQDERHYQASTLMNEFETKLDELHTRIRSCEMVIKDENGKIIDKSRVDYVVDNYYKRFDEDKDDGVEGVE